MYTLVLTHDIDYLSLREIPWSCKTLWGFSYRCLKAAVSFRQFRFGLLRRLNLVWDGISMPLIKLGLRSDPWEQSLDLMIAMERRLGVRSTLFYIPFPNMPGIAPSGGDAPANRAAFYAAGDNADRIRELEADGWEIGVHGINAYRSVESAEAEKREMETILGHDEIGIRMHWLYSRDEASWEILRRAGYRYDATFGWNEKVGFPGGRYFPFQPFEGDAFAQLPLNIQDQALFDGLGLSEDEALLDVQRMLQTANEHDGFVTLLWHNTSYMAPYMWGGLYERIVRQALIDGARIVRAMDAVKGGTQQWQRSAS